jgi:tripartite-type tricarboxylate transporter receptor subunit TctC
MMRALLAVVVLTLGAAHAQTFPSKPITIVVPFPPGGGVDFIARIVADKLPARLGRPVIIDNRGGALGMLGASVAAKAAPDGHTLFLIPNSLIIAPYILPKGAATVEITREFAPVITIVSNPIVLAVNPKLGVSTVAELVALARSRPGLPYTTPNAGSSMHILGEQFKRSAGVDLEHIGYKGLGPAIQDALGGQVSVLIIPFAGTIQHIRSGAFQVLAVATAKRSPQLPNVPSMVELGYANVADKSWMGLLAPAATPAPIIARLNEELNAILTLPDARDKLLATGLELEGGRPEELGTQMRDDDRRYARLIAELGIKSE